MTPLSRRYVPYILACLLPTLIPVLLHSYRGFQVDDCKNPSQLFPASSEGKTDEQPELWMHKEGKGIQWDEGTYASDSSGLRLNFVIARSYDPKRLYHRPEIMFVPDTTPDRRRVEWLENPTEKLPIHRAYYEPGKPTIMVAYLLVYNSTPVASPYLAQITAFPFQLVGGSRPMTMFFISARGPTRDFEAMERSGRQWLLACWRRYCATCKG